MRALTIEELNQVTGGQDTGGGTSGGGTSGGGTSGNGNSNVHIPNPGDFNGDSDWSAFYNEPFGYGGDYTSTGVQYQVNDNTTIEVGTLDYTKDPKSKVDGAQVTVTVKF